MFCPKCGAELQGDGAFCSKCGQKVEKAEKPDQMITEPVPSKGERGEEKAEEAKPDKEKKKQGIFFWAVQFVVIFFVGIYLYNSIYIPSRAWRNNVKDYVAAEIQEVLSETLTPGTYSIEGKDWVTPGEINKIETVSLTESERALLRAIGVEAKEQAKRYDVTKKWEIKSVETGQLLGTLSVRTWFTTEGKNGFYCNSFLFPGDELGEELLAYASAGRTAEGNNGAEYIGASIEGENLRIDYTWTNPYTTAERENLSLEVSAFQDSIGLTGYCYGDDFVDVQPGKTVALYEEFELRNITSPVEVIFAEGLFGDGPSFTVTIDLTELTHGDTAPAETGEIESTDEISDYSLYCAPFTETGDSEDYFMNGGPLFEAEVEGNTLSYTLSYTQQSSGRIAEISGSIPMDGAAVIPFESREDGWGNHVAGTITLFPGGRVGVESTVLEYGPDAMWGLEIPYVELLPTYSEGDY